MYIYIHTFLYNSVYFYIKRPNLFQWYTIIIVSCGLPILFKWFIYQVINQLLQISFACSCFNNNCFVGTLIVMYILHAWSCELEIHNCQFTELSSNSALVYIFLLIKTYLNCSYWIFHNILYLIGVPRVLVVIQLLAI